MAVGDAHMCPGFLHFCSECNLPIRTSYERHVCTHSVEIFVNYVNYHKLISLVWMPLNGGEGLLSDIFCGECRARSDCTYVQSDLALHSPQNIFLVANGRIRAKTRFPVPILKKLCLGLDCQVYPSIYWASDWSKISPAVKKLDMYQNQQLLIRVFKLRSKIIERFTIDYYLSKI